MDKINKYINDIITQNNMILENVKRTQEQIDLFHKEYNAQKQSTDPNKELLLKLKNTQKQLDLFHSYNRNNDTIKFNCKPAIAILEKETNVILCTPTAKNYDKPMNEAKHDDSDHPFIFFS